MLTAARASTPGEASSAVDTSCACHGDMVGDASRKRQLDAGIHTAPGDGSGERKPLPSGESVADSAAAGPFSAGGTTLQPLPSDRRPPGGQVVDLEVDADEPRPKRSRRAASGGTGSYYDVANGGGRTGGDPTPTSAPGQADARSMRSRTPKARSVAARKTTKRRRPLKKPDRGVPQPAARPSQIEKLLTDPKSELTEINIELLFDHATVDHFSMKEKEELFALLPDVDLVFRPEAAKGKRQAKPSTETNDRAREKIFPIGLVSDFFDNVPFRQSLLAFQKDLAAGRLLPENVEKARRKKARAERRSAFYKKVSDAALKPVGCQGDFENDSELSSSSSESWASGSEESNGVVWKDEMFEAKWGDRLREQIKKDVAGNAASLDIRSLCQYGLIRRGDILCYSKLHKGLNRKIETMMTVLSTETHQLKIGFSDSDVVGSVVTAQALVNMCLDREGVPKDQRPNGNGYKNISIVREGVNLGRLFDVRQEFYHHQRA